MKWHYKLAQKFGYDLVRSERNNWIYERHLTNVFKTYKVDLVLDVGANCGQFATGLRQYGYTGEIISFEPVTRCYDILSAAAKNDSNWKVEKLALGNAKESREINIPKSSVFSSFLNTTEYSQKKYEDHLTDFYKETIDITTLELYFANGLPANKRIFLKIDTQGFDLNVLIGAQALVSKLVGISTELSFVPLYEQSGAYDQVLAFLKKNDFVISNIFPVVYDEQKHLLVEADGVALNKKFVGL